MYSNQWWHTRDYLPAKDSVEVQKPYYIDPYAEIPNSHIVKPSGDFFAQGLFGQYLYMYPEKNLIIVRVGSREGFKMYWPEVFKGIARKN